MSPIDRLILLYHEMRYYACDRCEARGWRKFIIHNCYEEMGLGW